MEKYSVSLELDSRAIAQLNNFTENRCIEHPDRSSDDDHWAAEFVENTLPILIAAYPYHAVRADTGPLRGQYFKATLVNPGDWFWKGWLVGILGVGWYYVEGDHESAVIDTLADHEEYGRLISPAWNCPHHPTDPEGDSDIDYCHCPDDEDYPCDLAGNDGHRVDLENVTMAKAELKLFLSPGLYRHWVEGEPL